MVVWLVGLSGAGKSTIGRALHEQWSRTDPGVVMVDGDAVRAASGADRGPADYSLAGRRRNGDRMVALCEEHDRAGRNVVCCILSVFDDVRVANRERFSAYFEVYVRASMEVLEQRDTKGLYARARAGAEPNVVGVDLPFEVPTQPDLVIDTEPGGISAQAAATEILGRLEERRAA